MYFYNQNDKLYQALIVDSEISEGEYRYKVHYKGWNKRRDEILPERKIIKQIFECPSEVK